MHSSTPVPELHDAEAPNRRSGGLPRAPLVGLLCAGISLGTVLFGTPASAAVPTAPNNLTVFPDRDFVSVDGYQDHVGEIATLTVRRSGVLIGATQAEVASGDVAFEVNHPGGVCWGVGTGLGVTPDIRPGDRVAISFAGVEDSATTVQDGFVDADVERVGSTVTVRGHLGSSVNPDNIEQRIVNPALTDAVGKRDVRAIPGPVVRPRADTPYESGLAVDTAAQTFTATYVFDDESAAVLAANASLGERLLSWEAVDAADNRQGITIAEYGEVGGPGDVGCPALAQDAVTSTSPSVVNAAAVASDGELTVSGASYNSAEVKLSVLADGVTIGTATATATPAPPASASPLALPGSQSWTTTIPMAALAGADDGSLEIRMTSKRVTADPAGGSPTEGVISGSSKLLVKDTVAPDAPVLSLGTGLYIGTQHVTVTGPADAAVLRYQLGGPGVADPTPSIGSTVTGQLAVSSSQTLKVVAFDEAGNASPVTTATYTVVPAVPVVTPPVVFTPPFVPGPIVVVSGTPVVPPATTTTPRRITAPSAPRGVVATGGTRGGRVTAKVAWRAPLSTGGAAIRSYRVSIRKVGSTVAVTRSVPATARSLTVKGLVRGARYRFTVVAVNSRGSSTASPRSAAVVAR